MIICPHARGGHLGHCGHCGHGSGGLVALLEALLAPLERLAPGAAQSQRQSPGDAEGHCDGGDQLPGPAPALPYHNPSVLQCSTRPSTTTTINAHSNPPTNTVPMNASGLRLMDPTGAP